MPPIYHTVTFRHFQIGIDTAIVDYAITSQSAITLLIITPHNIYRLHTLIHITGYTLNITTLMLNTIL